MQREKFKKWLINNYKEGMDESAADSRISNAQKVEKAFGDLDTHYDKDKLDSVLEILKYPQGETRALPNGIEISGDYYTGMASLRQGVRRYLDFKIDC